MPGLIAATAAGLAVLAIGADHFVLGAERVARALRVSPVIVGGIILGFGTSAPEILVSSIAAAQGSLDIAMANVAGSNIANLTLVLGLAVIIAPMRITSTIIRREAPVAAAAVGLFGVVLIEGVSRAEGVLLVGALGAVLALLIRSELGSEEEEKEIAAFLDEAHVHPLRQEIPRTMAGLIATVAGAQLLVTGARGIADRAGLSEGIIGLTLVAIGTSLPELATVTQAARRHQAELIVGNVLGSNIFNSLAVAGTAAIVGPGALVDANLIGKAAGVMIVVTIVAWGLLRSNRLLVRWQGGVLMSLYAGSVLVSSL